MHILNVVALDSVLAGRSMAPDRFSYHKSLHQCVLRLNTKLTIANIKKCPSFDKKDALLSNIFNEEFTLPQMFVSHGELVVYTPSDY